MKNIYIIILALCLLSCQKTDFSENEIQEPPCLTVESLRIDAQKALKIAEEIPDMFPARTKSPGKEAGNVAPILRPRVATKSGNGLIPDTLMYVVNYTGNNGYAFIPTDERLGKVIAYIENGNFRIQDTIDDSLSRMLVELMIDHQIRQHIRLDSLTREADRVYLEQTLTKLGIGESAVPTNGPKVKIISATGNDAVCQQVLKKYHTLDLYDQRVNPPYMQGYPGVIPEGEGLPQEEIDYYRDHGCVIRGRAGEYEPPYGVDPLIQTKWGQYEPFNNYAPKDCPAGCCPVALAQIMVYFQHPQKIPENKQFGGTDLHMDQLGQFKYGDSFKQASEELNHAVAALHKSLGKSLGVVYNEDLGSGVITAPLIGHVAALNTLDAFGYDKSNLEFWDCQRNLHLAMASLDEGKPLLVAGYENKLHTQGHYWIIDGYTTQNYSYVYYDFKFDENLQFNLQRGPYTEWHAEPVMLSCNFGWNGNHDGYFENGVFDTGNGYFQYQVRMLPFITPTN